MTVLEMGLLACAAVSLIALAIAVISLQRVRQQAGENEKLIQKLMREVAASSSGSVGMGQRLLAMEKRLQANAASANKKPEKIDYYNDDEFQPYSQAAQMFKLGMDCDEVARRCGLSRAEASLLEMMQKSSH